MATAIIFGLMFSAMLTLGLAPALYALLFRVNYSGNFHKLEVISAICQVSVSASRVRRVLMGCEISSGLTGANPQPAQSTFRKY